MNKGGKFLKKLWESIAGNLELTTELATVKGHRKG